jgi:hypothetical protein
MHFGKNTFKMQFTMPLVAVGQLAVGQLAMDLTALNYLENNATRGSLI